MKWLIGWNVALTAFLIWLSINMFFPNMWRSMPELSFFEMREEIGWNSVAIIKVKDVLIEIAEGLIEIGETFEEVDGD